ncbi:MAG: PTS sugar transporter subunit IIA [Bacilli bacterium]
MVNNLLIATHGCLAKELVDTATLIFGEHKGIVTYCLKEGMHVESFKLELESYIEEHKDENVLVLVDLLSGSPFNCMIPSLKSENVYLITGVNLPMVLEVAMQKDNLQFNDLCKLAKEVGVKGIVTKEDILK